MPDIHFKPDAFDPLDPRIKGGVAPSTPAGGEPPTPLPSTLNSWPPTQNLNENPQPERIVGCKINVKLTCWLTLLSL